MFLLPSVNTSVFGDAGEAPVDIQNITGKLYGHFKFPDGPTAELTVIHSGCTKVVCAV